LLDAQESPYSVTLGFEAGVDGDSISSDRKKAVMS